MGNDFIEAIAIDQLGRSSKSLMLGKGHRSGPGQIVALRGFCEAGSPLLASRRPATLPPMLSLAYLVTGLGLVFVGGAIALVQVILWLNSGTWVPAPLGLLWAVVGFSGPFPDVPMPGVFLILGAWLTWEGVKRKPPQA